MIAKLFSVILSVSCLLAEGVPQNKLYSFESTYPEGFGRIFQKEMTVKRIPKDRTFKGSEDRFVIVFKDEKTISVRLDFFTGEVQNKFQKLLDLEDTIKIRASAYESIVSDGVPGLSASAPKEASSWIPAGNNWHVEKVIYLISFEKT